MRPAISLAVLALGLSALPALVRAGPPPAPPVHTLLTGVEGAATAKAPEAWKVGMRMVWLSTNGVTQSHPGQMGMRRDPNGKLKDDKGNAWTETSPLGGTSGGVGYTVIDVIGADEDSFVLDVQQRLLPQGPDGPSKLVGVDALRVHRTGGEYFLHPALLAKVPLVESDTVVVFRGPYDTPSGPRPALRSTSVVGGYSSTVYDLESGVLLSASYAFVQERGDVHDQGGWMAKAKTLSTGTHRWRGMRVPTKPWATGTMPDWVASTRRLTYRGTTASIAPGLPGNSVGLTVVFTTKAVGPGWAIHEMATALDPSPGIPVIPVVASFASGTASSMGLFVDPGALGRLAAGQRIDEDPMLGTTSVEYVGKDADGRAVVGLLLAGPLQRIQSLYDAHDGRLVRQVTTEAVPGTNLTSVRDLRLASAE